MMEQSSSNAEVDVATRIAAKVREYVDTEVDKLRDEVQTAFEGLTGDLSESFTAQGQQIAQVEIQVRMLMALNESAYRGFIVEEARRLGVIGEGADGQAAGDDSGG